MTARLRDQWKHKEDSSDDEEHAKELASRGYDRKDTPTGATADATRSAPIANVGEGLTHTQHGAGLGHPGVNAHGPSEFRCGPLLNYKGMSGRDEQNQVWHGSVLVVTTPGEQEPRLEVGCMGSLRGEKGADPSGGPVNGYLNDDEGQGMLNGISTNRADFASQMRQCAAVKLFSDPSYTFWRFNIDIPMQTEESRWEYRVSGIQIPSRFKDRDGLERSFVVPALSQSMRIMFHSCNGFSVGTDTELWSGPALWNDVLRVHNQKPFHVMIGGGDQIYNDYVRTEGPLYPWTHIKNPKRRRDHHFDEELRAACDKFYCDNYVRWFSTEPFATANAQIPQINIWDDHGEISCFEQILQF